MRPRKEPLPTRNEEDIRVGFIVKELVLFIKYLNYLDSKNLT